MNLKKKNRNNKNNSSVIQSIFGSNNVFKGKFKLESPLRVDGYVSGQFISDSRIHISKTGKGKGVIYARFIEIGGQFIGDLHAGDKVIIRSTAIVKGNIWSSFLEIEEGAFYSGFCSINRDKKIDSYNDKVSLTQ